MSYRHTVGYKGQDYAIRFVEELKAELELSVSQKVCVDIDRLKGAAFYNQALAIELCRSVCMVTLYWPEYFSREHPFCSREFQAMERLEAMRLRLLADPVERTKSLIIILALRGFEAIPEAIRAKRMCKNFFPYTQVLDLKKDAAFQKDIIEITEYISGRVAAFQKVRPDPFGKCEGFRFLSNAAILPWIDKLAGKPRRKLPR